MPRVIETTVYKFDELNDKAKAKARDWFRQISAGDNDFADHLTCKGGEFETFAGYLGWTIDPRKQGKHELAIYWSGFSSQGDGLHFVGKWNANNVDATKLKEAAPKDQELHRLADTFARLAHDYRFGVGNLEERHSRYSHEFAVHPVLWVEHEEEPNDNDQEGFRDAARSLMRWMYRSLEESYEASQEDSNVAEVIRINEYEFTEAGIRFE